MFEVAAAGYTREVKNKILRFNPPEILILSFNVIFSCTRNVLSCRQRNSHLNKVAVLQVQLQFPKATD